MGSGCSINIASMGGISIKIGDLERVEIERQRRAGVRVHGDLFHQRVADALDDAADDLAARRFGMDDAAGVVHGDVVEHAHAAGVGVDFDLGEVGGEGIDDVGLAAGAQFRFADDGLFRLAPDDVTHGNFYFRRVGDRDKVIAHSQFRRLHFEQFRGAFEQLALGVFAACCAASPDVNVVVLPEVLCANGVVSVSAKVA